MLEDCLLLLPHIKVHDVRNRLSDFLKGNFTKKLLSENSEVVQTIENQNNPKCNDSKNTLDYVELTNEQEEVEVKKKDAHNKKDVIFTEEEDIRIWIEKNYSNHGYLCSICNVQKKSQGTLDKHVESKHNMNQYECLACNKTFQNPSRKILHDNTVHKGLKSSPCDLCGMILYNETSLKRHRGNLNCKSGKHIGQSQQGTSDEEVAKKHQQYAKRQEQYKADRVRVYCVLCDFTFFTAIEYKLHNQEHRESGRWKCNLPGCFYTAQKLTRLLRHKQICEFDKAKKTQKLNITEIGGNLSSCNLCEKSFSEPCNHNLHKLFVCSECGKAFSKSHLLKIHIRSHTGEKPFRCFQCDKSFSSSGHRRTHSVVHIGKEQFPCS